MLTRAASNILGLNAIISPGQGVICEQRAAPQLTASGALQRFTTKGTVIPVDTDKLQIEQIERVIDDAKGEHPQVLSISQPTFYGSVYTKDELKILSDFAHSHGMLSTWMDPFLPMLQCFWVALLKN